ncbi:MAG: iron-sulfur cluster assembly accessory protein [Calditrichaeota bacterium]|nr:iron-sulfur cluster assembly accessory protein [Candidatus Cloacimonadota bacterium]MCA9786990.1 iron-sulfur cluster assembly accessory protein [Candidatus Cloacimonadota bacterium]MCB1047055.1 iron-sulfur cluster assembly accessory protein [Calditrichota bacterium]MCB9475089.1 iron-sulfur cluster assembly accessory protein [Candidatus Delongbacteria bacterium]
MIEISTSAVAQVKRLMAEEAGATGLRVGVKGGGCSGMSYVLDFVAAPSDNDKIFENDGVRLFVDPKSYLYLNGTTLDWSGGLNGKGFVFNNPNATRTCGCGESFSV